MAHPESLRLALRTSYVYDQLPLTTCAQKHKVSKATAQNWKNKAKLAGDDWDKERDAVAVSAQGFEEATSTMFRQYIKQHQATMALLEDDVISDPMERIKALSTLSDSYAKQLATHRKYAPEISELAVALDVIKFLSDYLEQNNRDLLGEFLAILEPFGQELGTRYGKS